VQGKRDKLIGLKENVIVGRLIPAGTGGATTRVKRIATERDLEVIEARRAEAAARIPAPEGADAAGGFDEILDLEGDSGLVETVEGGSN
jgi:DNA-directed RNA polymerase subunit beta'